METKNAIPSYKDGLKELRSNLNNMLPPEALAKFDADAGQLEETHQNILKIGVNDQAPDFTLVNASGEQVSLSSLLDAGKVILVFYRGTWCPYCNLQLAQYAQVNEEIKKTGASLVAISPQTPDESLNIQEKNELPFEVLSDVGNIVARKFTTVFRNGDVPVNTMTELGFDFDAHYGDDSREIPVPAVFIIEKDGKVSFARTTGGDYRNRVEASEILEGLTA
ncbi:MAG: peroxiredoxin-like family protein [Bacteroidota bacterium]